MLESYTGSQALSNRASPSPTSSREEEEEEEEYRKIHELIVEALKKDQFGMEEGDEAPYPSEASFDDERASGLIELEKYLKPFRGGPILPSIISLKSSEVPDETLSTDTEQARSQAWWHPPSRGSPKRSLRHCRSSLSEGPRIPESTSSTDKEQQSQSSNTDPALSKSSTEKPTKLKTDEQNIRISPMQLRLLSPVVDLLSVSFMTSPRRRLPHPFQPRPLRPPNPGRLCQNQSIDSKRVRKALSCPLHLSIPYPLPTQYIPPLVPAQPYHYRGPMSLPPPYPLYGPLFNGRYSHQQFPGHDRRH